MKRSIITVALCIIILFSASLFCQAQSFEQFDKDIDSCFTTGPAVDIIQGCVDSYYRHYYQMPENYDDLVQFVTEDYKVDLVNICDSLLFKNRYNITFSPKIDTSTLFYYGKELCCLWSQYSCNDYLNGAIAIATTMVDTTGKSYYVKKYDDLIYDEILPNVYCKMEKTNCKRKEILLHDNIFACRIPITYDVGEKTLRIMSDCKRNGLAVCDDLIQFLQAELSRYRFDGVSLITFPVILYTE